MFVFVCIAWCYAWDLLVLFTLHLGLLATQLYLSPTQLFFDKCVIYTRLHKVPVIFTLPLIYYGSERPDQTDTPSEKNQQKVIFIIVGRIFCV